MKQFSLFGLLIFPLLFLHTCVETAEFKTPTIDTRSDVDTDSSESDYASMSSDDEFEEIVVKPQTTYGSTDSTVLGKAPFEVDVEFVRRSSRTSPKKFSPTSLSVPTPESKRKAPSPAPSPKGATPPQSPHSPRSPIGKPTPITSSSSSLTLLQVGAQGEMKETSDAEPRPPLTIIPPRTPSPKSPMQPPSSPSAIDSRNLEAEILAHNARTQPSDVTARTVSFETASTSSSSDGSPAPSPLASTPNKGPKPQDFVIEMSDLKPSSAISPSRSTPSPVIKAPKIPCWLRCLICCCPNPNAVGEKKKHNN